jgi:3',5'-cyclic AMP phosphodiesterase CpdA
VLDFVERHRPGLVVLSGDLTQRARSEQFRQAREFVDRILGAHAGGSPGNHDVPLYRFWERAFNPYRAYRQHFSPDLEPVFGTRRRLSSASTPPTAGRSRTAASPCAGSSRWRALREGAGVRVQGGGGSPPPDPAAELRDPAGRSNAYEAIDLFSRAGVDLILSGHQHQTYIGNSEEFYPAGRPPVVILHAGTTTSNRGRAGEREKNSCNWIEVDRRSMVVSHYRWHDSLGRFAEHSRHWYPRQELVPYTLEGLSATGEAEAETVPEHVPVG